MAILYHQAVYYDTEMGKCCVYAKSYALINDTDMWTSASFSFDLSYFALLTVV